jgi:hypothetical protein
MDLESLPAPDRSVPIEVLLREEDDPLRRRSVRPAVVLGTAIALFALALGITRWTRPHPGAFSSAANAPPPVLVPSPPPAHAVAPPPSPPHASPAPTTASPAPAPTTGTVIGAADHRLYVDGRLVTGNKSEVKCGKHVIQSGSQGTPRTVDVPCGGEITVAP